jgi:hypothetical protein
MDRRSVAADDSQRQDPEEQADRVSPAEAAEGTTVPEFMLAMAGAAEAALLERQDTWATIGT